MDTYLEFRGIGKSFPGVQALDDISFTVSGGRVCAILGENGAGKSTLLKILSGDIQPGAGGVYINGAEQRFTSPYQAIRSGISVIYQERQLIPAMNVMENIFLGDIPAGRAGFVDRAELRGRTQEIIDSFGLPIHPLELVGRLPVAYQQMVEIMKAYRRNSKIIAFDEPTASLTDSEISILFELIGKLRNDGKIVLYVSHRLSEIFQITDEIVVLKDGRFVKTLETRETDEQELITAMVGRDIGDTYSGLKRNDRYGETLLEVSHLETAAVHDISFELKSGEILGLSGLVGAGRTEVVRAIFGADAIISGEIKLEGKPVHFKKPGDAIAAGIALCPEDRKEQGLVLLRSIRDNITAPVLDKVRKGLFLDKKAEDEVAGDAIKKYSIKTPSSDKPVLELSGGNQQKVILGRWTSSKMVTKVLILDEPTKGIDVGTKAEVYRIVCDFARDGIGVIFISSELTEVINVADRIIVMRNGRITGEVRREEASEESVLALAMSE
ncbi:MAG: sugar ABC transporter ATP-binding protein [Oscillospiraceae bacterium]|jgi:ABC-type sugar transport system ATPase subunit|nr:sugar ABC transporter ATP-binding protein [Oscillospiraceae bacterium]